MIETKTNSYTAWTDNTTGHKEPEAEMSRDMVDYLNTKNASLRLYNKKHKIVVKKLHINKSLLPRKVV